MGERTERPGVAQPDVAGEAPPVSRLVGTCSRHALMLESCTHDVKQLLYSYEANASEFGHELDLATPRRPPDAARTSPQFVRRRHDPDRVDAPDLRPGVRPMVGHRAALLRRLPNGRARPPRRPPRRLRALPPALGPDGDLAGLVL